MKLVQGSNVLVSVFAAYPEGSAAVEALHQSGFGPSNLSAAATDRSGSQSDADCSEFDEFWRRICPLVSGCIAFRLDPIGPVSVVGRLAKWVPAMLPNLALFGGLSAVGSALYSMGLSREASGLCDAALSSGGVLVVVHGDASDVQRARTVLESTLAPAGGYTAGH